MTTIITKTYEQELNDEITSTRACIERVPPALYTWKSHDNALSMGSLVQMLADIPNWISIIIEEPNIDFATYKNEKLSTAAEAVAHFDKTMKKAQHSFQHTTDEQLQEDFSLTHSGNILTTNTKQQFISQTINHLVHHRGQLTVYMRMNNIPIPKIYGPSGDDKTW